LYDCPSGYSIAYTVSDIFYTLFAGMGAACTYFISRVLGENKLEEAKSNAYRLLKFVTLVALAEGVLFILASFFFFSLYQNTAAETRNYASYVLIVMGCFFCVMTFVSQCYMTLRAGGDTKLLMFFDSGFQWLVYIPFVAAIAYWSDVDFYWLFFLSQLPDVLKAVVGWIIVKKEKWVKNLTITEGEAT
jgi:Na+-driven multidrug efflux pump